MVSDLALWPIRLEFMEVAAIVSGVNRLFVVVSLVILAGCAGFGPDTAERDHASPEPVSPVPVPEDDPDTEQATTDDEGGLSGIDEDGVSDHRALAKAHARWISNHSYTLVSVQTVHYENGTLYSQYATTLRLSENRTYLVSIQTDGPGAPGILGTPPQSAEFWSDGDTYVRAFGRNDTVYNEFTPTASGVATWQFWSTTGSFDVFLGPTGMIEESFDSIPTRVVRAESIDGMTRYRLQHAERTDTPLPFPEAEPAQNVSLDAVVDKTGLVHHLELDYRGHVDGAPVVVNRSISYTSVGATEVDRPEWFEMAVADDWRAENDSRVDRST